MKIAMVSPYDWSVPGGVNSHIEHLSALFREWGHEVAVFAPSSRPEENVSADVVCLGRPMSVPASGSVARITFSWKSPAAKAALAEGGFDIVHLHEPLMPLLPYHFLRYSRAANVGTFHAAKEGGNRVYSYTRQLTRRWFRKLDGKIAVSPAAVGLVSRYFAGYYNIIPNGIDYPHFSQECEPFPEFMDGKRNILFVGRPEKRKGLKYLIRAYTMLKATMPDTRLIIVGAGDFQAFQNATEGVPDIVFRSNVPYEDLPRYHRSAHAFCAPNTGNESQGYVLLEALAAGVPVVASNIEGFAGVITNDLDGLLVTPRDEAAIADGIARVLTSPRLAESLVRHGKVRAEQFSWDNVGKRVFSYYERLVWEHHHVRESRRSRSPHHQPNHIDSY